MKNYLYSFFWVILICFITGCDTERFNIDVSNLKEPVHIVRLDSAVFHSGIDDAGKLNRQLEESYPGFYPLYLRDILQIGKPDEPMVEVGLGNFLDNPAGYQTQKEIDRVYADMSAQENSFARGMAYFRYYFPSVTVPRFIAYNSGFNVGVYPTDSILGFGLEWYLGSDNPIVKRLPVEGFPNYKRRKMSPEYLVANSLKGWLMVKYKDRLPLKTVVENMLFYGKVYYLLHALTPWLSDSLRMNYSTEQWRWAQDNEYRSWKHLIKEELIYSDNQRDIARLFNDAPFTKGMPQESPGRMGAWLGLQMVEAYMDKHPNTTIRALLHQKTTDKFLRSYKPGR